MAPAGLNVLKRSGSYVHLNAHWKKRSLPAQAVGI
jgi:hypothetical protein